MSKSRWSRWRALRVQVDAVANASSSDEEVFETETVFFAKNDSDVFDGNLECDVQNNPIDTIDVPTDPESSGEEAVDSFSDEDSEGLASGISSDETLSASNVACDSDSTLKQKLAVWAAKGGQTRESINGLLGILRSEGHLDLPRDKRTLLKTPRNVCVEDKCGGKYIYIGIENAITNILLNNSEILQKSDIISVKVNIDGLPIFKSSTDSLWPILMSFGEFRPFMVAIFYGKTKPTSVESYLKDFIDEVQKLQLNGISFNGKLLQFKVDCFLCDAPARAFLKRVKSHSGYSSCERCTQHGSWNGRVIYSQEEDTSPRTDEEFSQMEYLRDGHQLGVTPLIHCGINCVSQFPLDYLHLVCLGVMKRILFFLKQGPKCCKLSAGQLRVISTALTNLRGKMPSDFARQPRGLDELERWKATEYRQFLLYTGPVVLKNVLAPNMYTHFLTFTVGISLLLANEPDCRRKNCVYARQLLEFFVKKAVHIYGSTFVVFNVHNLKHIADDVENHDCSLNDISCFPFESHLQTLKKMVKNSRNPIAQIVKRENEQRVSGIEMPRKIRFVVSTRPKDRYFRIGNSFCVLRERRSRTQYLADVIHTGFTEDFFQKPCSSKLLGIVYIPSPRRYQKRLVEIIELQHKVVCLEADDGFVLMPLLHGPERD